jgi:aryl carrier-like protein
MPAGNGLHSEQITELCHYQTQNIKLKIQINMQCLNAFGTITQWDKLMNTQKPLT